MANNSSLLLSAAKLTDQRTFTCMVVAGADITEYPVNVVIYSEYSSVKAPDMSNMLHTEHLKTPVCFFPFTAEMPTGLEISDKAAELEIGKLTKVCF